jgi:predicted component of type VI protein secretion system
MLHICIISGNSKGKTVALEPATLPMTIGRDPENSLVLEHTAISRYHCRITSENGLFFVQDLGSTNGTYLNGRRISRERLSPGDELIIANIGCCGGVEVVHHDARLRSTSVSIDVGQSRPSCQPPKGGTREFLGPRADRNQQRASDLSGQRLP